MVRTFFLLCILTALACSQFAFAQDEGALTQVQNEMEAAVPDTTNRANTDTTVNQKISPAYYQDLGNTYYDDREYGRAILSYERGLRLSPGNAALRNNLRFVRGDLGMDRPEIKEFFLARWWRSLGAFFGVATAKWMALLFWALAVAGATLWYLRREGMAETRRFALLPLAGLMLALATFFYLLGDSRQAYLAYDGEAILTARMAELRVAPGADATLEEQLNEGLKVRILDTFDSYVKVSLEDGRQGWVPDDALERI